MRIGHVSTFWPKHCAFPAYTDALIAGMRAHRADAHVVLAERPADAAETAAWTCIPTFHRSEDYVAAIVAGARAQRLDVVEVQYANDVLGDDHRFPRLLAALRDAGVATVVNCHSVYPPGWRTGYRPAGNAKAFDLAVAAAASSLVVHTPRMQRELAARGVPADKIAVIPHGTRAVALPPQAESRARLGVPAEAKVVLFFGFIWSGKGLDFLLSAFARVARRVPDAVLYVGGHPRRPTPWGAAYMAYLKLRARLYGIAGRVRFHGAYVPDALVNDVYGAADVVALPYRQAYSSVSAVVHQAAGMGRIPFCSRIAKFEEVGERVAPHLLAPLDDVTAWAAGLERLLVDETFAADTRRALARFAEETSWEKVGAARLALYDALGDAPSEAAAARVGAIPFG